MSAARTALRAGRRNSLVVTVRRSERPRRRIRVEVSGKQLRIVRRTNARGRAHFVVRPRSSERRLLVRALGHTCQSARIPVRR